MAEHACYVGFGFGNRQMDRSTGVIMWRWHPEFLIGAAGFTEHSRLLRQKRGAAMLSGQLLPPGGKCLGFWATSDTRKPHLTAPTGT
jgi:hypothetical protein